MVLLIVCMYAVHVRLDFSDQQCPTGLYVCLAQFSPVNLSRSLFYSS